MELQYICKYGLPGSIPQVQAIHLQAACSSSRLLMAVQSYTNLNLTRFEPPSSQKPPGIASSWSMTSNVILSSWSHMKGVLNQFLQESELLPGGDDDGLIGPFFWPFKRPMFFIPSHKSRSSQILWAFFFWFLFLIILRASAKKLRHIFLLDWRIFEDVQEFWWNLWAKVLEIKDLRCLKFSGLEVLGKVSRLKCDSLS